VSERVDYDRLALTYDARYAANRRSETGEALRQLVEARGAALVLEVGCGTGHWLQELAPSVSFACGLDLSSGMLGRAREKAPLLPLARGRAAQLGFASRAFDLVYCVNAIHHFRRPGAFVAEAARLLRHGGTLAVIGMDPRGQHGRWYVYTYFEGVYERDLARFPSWGTVMDWMVGEGFEQVECRIVERLGHDLVGRAVLDHPFLRKGSCSQLALLSDEAYAEGLRRIEAALERAASRAVEIVFPVDTPLAMVSGQRREGR
jgi:SAM-dependent methyltransferase